MEKETFIAGENFYFQYPIEKITCHSKKYFPAFMAGP